MTVKAPKKSQQTREHILETALKLFTEKGYAETTMRDIAERCRLLARAGLPLLCPKRRVHSGALRALDQ